MSLKTHKIVKIFLMRSENFLSLEGQLHNNQFDALKSTLRVFKTNLYA